MILCVSLASAELLSVDIEEEGSVTSEKGNFTVEYKPVNNQITLDGTAVYDFTLHNGLNVIDSYHVEFISTGEWRLTQTDPLYYGLSGITNLKQKSSLNFLVKISPVWTIGMNRLYHAQVKIVSEKTNEEITVILPITVMQSDIAKLDYLPNIQSKINIPENIDPRNDNKIIFTMQNRNKRNISEIKVKFTSKLLGMKEIKTTLGPEELKSIEIPFPLDPLQSPMDDVIVAEITVDEYATDTKMKEFKVIDYTGMFGQDLDERKETFKTTKIFTITNDGNVGKTQIFSVRMSFFASWFTSAEPKARVARSGGSRIYSWDITIQPGESTTVTVVTNYKGFAYTVEVLALIAVILVILYFIYRSPVSIRKEVDNVQRKEGGISEFKVLLHVKNLSDHIINEIEVLDYVPNLIDVIKEFTVGTLNPTKVLKHEKKGNSMIKWDIDKLEPSEERIISYHIKSKLTILGDFVLPTALVRFLHNGKRLKVSSNSKKVAYKEA